jgi:hypothetical protein
MTYEGVLNRFEQRKTGGCFALRTLSKRMQNTCQAARRFTCVAPLQSARQCRWLETPHTRALLFRA